MNTLRELCLFLLIVNRMSSGARWAAISILVLICILIWLIRT